jgi:hypothetical protein
MVEGRLESIGYAGNILGNVRMKLISEKSASEIKRIGYEKNEVHNRYEQTESD